MNLMNNVYRIDEFLKLIAAGCNDKHAITSDMVYANLIYLGIDEKKVDISNNFSKWRSYFRNIKNIDVFVDPFWSYFCQFINSNYGRNRVKCDVKLYIPVGEKQIQKSAEYLFEYLANENIPHVSKIGKHVRFDDIVIRTNSKENANKIIEFVNKNQYIKDGMLPASPFAVCCDGVSLAWDDNLSYNMVVSSWISDYINFERENNNLNNVSYSRFYAYICKKTDELFNKGVGLTKHINKIMRENVIHGDGLALVANYYDVTNLLIMSLDPKMNKEKLFDFIDNVSSYEHQKMNINNIRRLFNDDKRQQDVFTEEQRKAFKMAYQSMCDCRDGEKTKLAFEHFIKTGDYCYITRTNGARGLLISNNINREVAEAIVTFWKSESIDKAIMTTYNKYGFNQVYRALINVVDIQDYYYFTNDQNSRDELMARCMGSDILKIMKDVLFYEDYDVPVDEDGVFRMYLDRTMGNGKRDTRSL